MVAPRAGAGIEITGGLHHWCFPPVAPRAGAGIEIIDIFNFFDFIFRRPSRRGGN